MSTDERLYNLLPAIYRVRDAAQGEPLRALLGVVEAELRALDRDVEDLYHNWFVETCDEWVVPYLGDLLGVLPLRPPGARGFSMRSYVANTLAYRRRKGTAAVLEQLARDLTGWPAHAVEMFELLGWTQHLNHLRPHAVRTPDLRNVNHLDQLRGPFHRIGHTVDVRRIARGRGLYNIPNVGIFLWRLEAFPLEGATAARTGPGRFTFSPLGMDLPLFHAPQTETAIEQATAEVHVAAPVRPVAFHFDLAGYHSRYGPVALADRPAGTDAYYGPDRSLHVLRDGVAVPPMDVVCGDLSRWDRPDPGRVAVDVLRGRIAFAEGEEPDAVAVSYAYGFSAPIGGGPYDRRRPRVAGEMPGGPDTVARPDSLDVLLRVGPGQHPTLLAAWNAWAPANDPRAVIQIEDNVTYAESLDLVLAGEEVVIQAANLRRPAVIGDITLTGGTGRERVTLSGLLLAGAVRVEGQLGELNLFHCTLTPDHPSVVVQGPNDRLRVRIESCVTGPLQLPAEIAGVEVRDSILGQPGRHTPALLSGPVNPFPAAFPSAAPQVDVTLGWDGPHTLAFNAPGDLNQARARLENALRAVPGGPAFTRARVLRAGDQLLIIPGVPVSVSVTPTPTAPGVTDPTADALKLTADARTVPVLVSADLDPFPTLKAAAPALQVSGGDEGTRVVVLAPKPGTLATARNRLAAALPQSIVIAADDRLLLLPANGTQPLHFGPAPGDPATVAELGLESEQPALAGGDHLALPGPPAVLERCTVFGAVHVRELELASEVLFTAPVRVERRQSGCVRFSYLPPGSRTPRRFRCQPELAVEAAREQGIEDPAAHARIRSRIAPLFTSVRWGDPAYAQLALRGPDELRTGGADGGEMGAFASLKQPQREANLRAGLDEYLRFGLEAGIFYVT